MISHIYYVKVVNSFTNPVDYKHIAKTCAPEELSKKIEDRMIYEMDRMGCEDENIQVGIKNMPEEFLNDYRAHGGIGDADTATHNS